MDHGFPTTAWTFIEGVQDESDPAAYTAAMNAFLAAYWKPVFYFLRARGHPLHDAEDLTQEFFFRFYTRRWIRRADRERGRFRTFLLTLLTRFLSDRGSERAPRQQVFERQLVTVSSLMDDRDRTYEPAAHEQPETVFMKQWAAALVERVRSDVRQRYAAEGKADWWAVFEAAYASDPAGERTTQEALAKRFGLTRDQVRHRLEQVQDRFGAMLRAAVRDEVGSEADVRDEVRELLTLLER